MSILLNLKTGIKNKNYKVKSISICNKNMLYRLSALGIKKAVKYVLNENAYLMDQVLLK